MRDFDFRFDVSTSKVVSLTPGVVIAAQFNMGGGDATLRTFVVQFADRTIVFTALQDWVRDDAGEISRDEAGKLVGMAWRGVTPIPRTHDPETGKQFRADGIPEADRSEFKNLVVAILSVYVVASRFPPVKLIEIRSPQSDVVYLTEDKNVR